LERTRNYLNISSKKHLTTVDHVFTNNLSELKLKKIAKTPPNVRFDELLANHRNFDTNVPPKVKGGAFFCSGQQKLDI
jgi:predicted nucleic acid binding AN1-type Zn finger protein